VDDVRRYIFSALKVFGFFFFFFWDVVYPYDASYDSETKYKIIMITLIVMATAWREGYVWPGEGRIDGKHEVK
jgi:hypothetical protein